MTDNISHVFSRAAETYDQIGPRFFTHFGRALVQFAELAPGSRVLDIATGRGAVLFPASQDVGPDGHVVGIDVAEGMIQATGREAVARQISNVQLTTMSADQLNFPDASFDAVLCGFAVFFFPDLAAALAEFKRVLKPGGKLAISTWINVFGDEFDWFDDVLKENLPSARASQPTTSDEPPAPVFSTAEGVEAILVGAGLSDIRIRPESAVFYYRDEEEWWASLWSHGVRYVLEKVQEQRGQEGLEELKAQLLTQARAQRKPDGIQQVSSALLAIGVKPSN